MSATLQRAAGNAEQADASFPLRSRARLGCALSLFMLQPLVLRGVSDQELLPQGSSAASGIRVLTDAFFASDGGCAV